MSDKKKLKLSKKKLARLDKATLLALLQRPWYSPPCKKCPALSGGDCGCARKQLKKMTAG